MEDKGKYAMLGILIINIAIKAAFGLIEASMKINKKASNEGK